MQNRKIECLSQEGIFQVSAIWGGILSPMELLYGILRELFLVSSNRGTEAGDYTQGFWTDAEKAGVPLAKAKDQIALILLSQSPWALPTGTDHLWEYRRVLDANIDSWIVCNMAIQNMRKCLAGRNNGQISQIRICITVPSGSTHPDDGVQQAWINKKPSLPFPIAGLEVVSSFSES